MRSKKVCSVAQFGCRIPSTALFLRKATIQNQAACVQVRNYSFQCFITCCFAARPSPQGFLYDLHMCACCDCVLLIKMICAMKWITVRERCAESSSFSRPDLAGSRGKTVSRNLEQSPDAVDDLTSIGPRHAVHAQQHAAA